MDDSSHRENGRHKPPQGQWLMHHQPSMKQIMSIMAERDAAIQERNLAISEKKTALAERDMAIMQRDSAISERNNAIMERDNAIATLHYRETAMNNNADMSPCPPGCQIARGVKHIHHPHHPPHMVETPYTNRDMHVPETVPLSPVTLEPKKPGRAKRAKETKPVKPAKSASRALKSSKRVKQEGEDLSKTMFAKNGPGPDMGSGSDDFNKTMFAKNRPDSDDFNRARPGWKEQDLGLNQVAYDETTMPVPVCSCTGVIRACYKWGNGGWQSSCCTTNLSMYPLPAVPNKRHARVGGRKMSGSAFNKLLSRLAAEGHDLSNPVDLKDNWAKHGTNRYITIK